MKTLATYFSLIFLYITLGLKIVTCLETNVDINIELNNLFNKVGIIQNDANSPIEDRYIALELSHFPGYFLSVLDGHGGHQTAEFASKNLGRYFDNSYKDLSLNNTGLSSDAIITQALLSAFERVEKEYFNQVLENKDLIHTGSCALVVLVMNNKIYTAQLGDAKARLYRKKESGIDAKYQIIKLTNTHNSGKLDEQVKLLEEFPMDKDIFVCSRSNNDICYVKGRLQPTRSFGDFYLKNKEFYLENNKGIFNGPYIKAIPEIKVFEITKHDEYIVLATDGLSDFLKAKEIAEILSFGKVSNQDLADKLLKSVITKASKEIGISVDEIMAMEAGENKRNIHDDITIIVFYLK